MAHTPSPRGVVVPAGSGPLSWGVRPNLLRRGGRPRPRPHGEVSGRGPRRFVRRLGGDLPRAGWRRARTVPGSLHARRARTRPRHSLEATGGTMACARRGRQAEGRSPCLAKGTGRPPGPLVGGPGSRINPPTGPGRVRVRPSKGSNACAGLRVCEVCRRRVRVSCDALRTRRRPRRRPAPQRSLATSTSGASRSPSRSGCGSRADRRRTGSSSESRVAQRHDDRNGSRARSRSEARHSH
jgi:hypothetical protein